MTAPTCDGRKECPEPIAYIDHKGWVYCTSHGQHFQASRPCRKLRPHELRRILSGQPVERY